VHHIYNDEEMLRRLKQSAGFASLLALRHFKELVRKRERELLIEARRMGMGWRALSGFLGVSEQAVQQRWKRLIAELDRQHEKEWGQQLS
jgi:hypothetical protein